MSRAKRPGIWRAAASFAAINTDFGGIDAYLGQVGLDPAKRAALRTRLIA